MSIDMQVRIGALVQEVNMLIPYADMLNHSFEPNCFFHWRFKDRMLEVMVNAGQQIEKGELMTVNYMGGMMNEMFMKRYGFSSPVGSNVSGKGGSIHCPLNINTESLSARRPNLQVRLQSYFYRRLRPAKPTSMFENAKTMKRVKKKHLKEAMVED